MQGLENDHDSLGEGLFPRRSGHADAEFDITAMIDLVFMMNIYFLVTFILASAGQGDFPSANNVKGIDMENAIAITIMPGTDAKSVVVYLGEGETGTPIRDANEQAVQVTDAVERASSQGKTAVVLKADRTITLREINRVALATVHDGMTLHYAVIETDTGK